MRGGYSPGILQYRSPVHPALSTFGTRTPKGSPAAFRQQGRGKGFQLGDQS